MIDYPEAVARVCDAFIALSAIIHLNSMTRDASKCEMCTWWLVGMAAATDFFFGAHREWDDVMMNVAFATLTFESVRSHFYIPRLCRFRDRRRKHDFA